MQATRDNQKRTLIFTNGLCFWHWAIGIDSDALFVVSRTLRPTMAKRYCGKWLVSIMPMRKYDSISNANANFELIVYKFVNGWFNLNFYRVQVVQCLCIFSKTTDTNPSNAKLDQVFRATVTDSRPEERQQDKRLLATIRFLKLYNFSHSKIKTRKLCCNMLIPGTMQK